MARNETEAGPWHVWARGVERRVIFGDDEDRRLYLGLLRGVAEKCGWRVLAYCLMPNHIHLLVETQQPNLGRGIQRLHGTYALAFNQRWTRVGHLFQSRFGSRFLSDEAAVARVLAYIAANPVAAGLCEQPRDWTWSSAAAGLADRSHPLIDRRRVREWLAPFGDPQAVYEAFLQARLLNRELPLLA